MESTEKVNILLVDDRPENLVALQAILGDLGENLVPALSGEEALKRLLEQEFAVIMLDVRMPGIDGFETARLIRERPRTQHTPIIFLTAADRSDTHMSRGYELGAVDYLFKPFVPEILRSKIAVFTDLFRRAEDLRRREQAAYARELADQRQRLEEADQALAQTRRELKHLFEHLDEIFFSLDARSHAFLQLAPACEHVFGVPRQAFLEEPGLWRSSIVAEDRGVWESMEQDLLAGEAASGDYRIRRTDGAIRWIHARAKPVVDKAGQVLAIDGIASDITERKQAEEALRESEERFRQLAENIREVFWISGARSHHKLYVSPAYDEIWGRPRETLFERPEAWKEAIHPEDREHLEADMEEQRREHYELEYRIVRADGDVRWIWDRAFPIRNDRGEVYRIAGIAEDVTDRKQLAKRMLQAQKLESLAVLAGGIAHDFNNLLMGISGHAGLALLRLHEESPAREPIRQVEDIVQRAAGLTKQILAYSGRGRFLVEHLDLSRVVEGTIPPILAALPARVTLRYDLATELPAVEADATQLRQVVTNLITNAVDAMGTAGGTITLATGALEADRGYLDQTYIEDDLAAGCYAYVEVTDSGCGMASETLQKLFDPFFTTKFTGRGLGLAAVLGIARGHKGAIKVDSEPGQGTTVRMLLPCVERPHAAPAAASPPAEHEPAWRGRGAILVVDDEPTVRTVAREILEAHGFRVLTAADGREGVALFQQHAGEIAAVLLDMTMPVMNGEEAFREIRRIRPDARVILSSGYSSEEINERFATQGLTGFLQKPYDIQAMIAKLREVLHQ